MSQGRLGPRGAVRGTNVPGLIQNHGALSLPSTVVPHNYQFQPTHILPLGQVNTHTVQENDIQDKTLIDKLGFGGYMENNNPFVSIESNSTVHVHYEWDKSRGVREWHLAKGFALVMFRDYAAQSLPHPGSTPRDMRSINWTNWWMCKGKGDELLRNCKNAKFVLELFRIIGVKTSASREASTKGALYNEDITVTTYKRDVMRNFWAWCENYESSIVMNQVQDMCALWWLIKRVKRVNPYEAMNPTTDPEILRYWRIEPYIVPKGKALPPCFSFNNEDPEGVDDYTGFPVFFGYMNQQLDRYGGNPLDKHHAALSLFPEEDNEDFVRAADQLPRIEVMVKV